MIRCPECKKIVDEKNNSCQYCGYPFNGTEEKITIKYCTECGAPIEEGLEKCPECGKLIDSEILNDSLEDTASQESENEIQNNEAVEDTDSNIESVELEADSEKKIDIPKKFNFEFNKKNMIYMVGGAVLLVSLIGNCSLYSKYSKCLKELTANNIIFEATNKSKYDVEWLQLDISLDGTQLSLYADSSSDQNIKAGETREIVQVGDIDIPEHNKMSLSGDIFIDGSSKGTIDVCDVDLGGNENTYSTLEKEKLVYDDENVAVYYNSIDINQMNFCIENKMGNAITVGFWGDEDLKIDGSVYGSSVATINSHSSGIYIGYLYSSSNDNIQIMDFQKFDGIMKIKNQKNQDIESINLNFTSD